MPTNFEHATGYPVVITEVKVRFLFKVLIDLSHHRTLVRKLPDERIERPRSKSRDGASKSTVARRNRTRISDRREGYKSSISEYQRYVSCAMSQTDRCLTGALLVRLSGTSRSLQLNASDPIGNIPIFFPISIIGGRNVSA